MNLQEALQHPQALRFSENAVYKDGWEAGGGRIVELPTGHMVLYGRHGRRLLMADPEGHPLHECVWQERAQGLPVLRAARIRLDWDHWVGIKPEGLMHSLSLDLTRRPDWERITRDDLRLMAARSMNSDLATVKFFYRDDDVELQPNGSAIIRQVKDAFYVLREGSFEQAQFMSCMSRLQWARIDYLPVVELFLSLLPGTGSATFELIRGLYDDQNPDVPLPLRYRGIPVYPSEGAFRLFSAFFTPSTPSAESAHDVFLDPQRSHDVQWNPAPAYPVRYVDEDQRITVTVQDHHLQKVTCWDDPAGVAYFPVFESGKSFLDNRGASILQGELILYDGHGNTSYNIHSSWRLRMTESGPPWQPFSSSWRDCFPNGPPRLAPAQAFSAVLLYPDKQEEIGEKESQPFVFDFVDDFLETHAEILRKREGAERVFLSHCEAALNACLKWHRPQQSILWYRWPEFAQKYAQQIWNTLNRRNQLDWIKNFQFYEFEARFLDESAPTGDFFYLWIPFSDYPYYFRVERWTKFLADHISPEGIACIAGPANMGEVLQRHNLQVIHAEQGESLPTFRIHQAILPYGRLNPELTVWMVQPFSL